MSAPTVTGAPLVRLRPAVAADDAFLRRVYVDARPELQLLPPQLVDLQLAAQRAQYRRDHPRAVDEVVEVGGEPVGRCWTAIGSGELHILDFVVRADRRRQGIGRTVLDVVADRAATLGLAVRLAVWSANVDARRLYLAAGFAEVCEAGGHVVMRRAPRSRS